MLIYRGVVGAEAGDTAVAFERLFEKKSWPPTLYDFHHYHPAAHEVLGVVRGNARLILGGPKGHDIRVRPSDVVLLPAGIGHCRREASPDFMVVGAYPPDQDMGICREAASGEMIKRMEHLPFPASDPVSGKGGPMTALWAKG